MSENKKKWEWTIELPGDVPGMENNARPITIEGTTTGPIPFMESTMISNAFHISTHEWNRWWHRAYWWFVYPITKLIPRYKPRGRGITIPDGELHKNKNGTLEGTYTIVDSTDPQKQTKTQLEAKCKKLLWDIDRRQPGGRGRYHLEVRLKSRLEQLRLLELEDGKVT